LPFLQVAKEQRSKGAKGKKDKKIGLQYKEKGLRAFVKLQMCEAF